MIRRTRLAVASALLAGPLAVAQSPMPPLKPIEGFSKPATAPAPVQPAGGQLPTAPPPQPARTPTPVPPDETTAKHLDGWEAAMKGVKTYYAKATKNVKNEKMKRETQFDVSVWLMTPNLARMDEAKTAAPGKEANPPDLMIISTGKTVYEYDGVRKVRSTAALGPGGAGNNLLLDLMSGPSARQLAARFSIATVKQDENFVFLEVRPVFAADKEEFETLTVVLCGAKFKDRAYIPRMVIITEPGGETKTTWDFPDPKVNPQGITETYFNPVDVPKGWKDETKILPRAVAPGGGLKAPAPTTPPGK